MSHTCQEWKVQVPNSMIWDSGISDAAFRTLLTLQSFIRNNDTAWPSLETLAEKRGKKVRAVKRHISELKKLKLVEVVIRKTCSSIYSIPADTEATEQEPTTDNAKTKNDTQVSKMTSQSVKNDTPECQKRPLPYYINKNEKEEDEKKKDVEVVSSKSLPFEAPTQPSPPTNNFNRSSYLKQIADTCTLTGKPLPENLNAGLSNILGQVSDERLAELTPYVCDKITAERPTTNTWWQDGAILRSLRNAYMGTHQDPTPWAYGWRDKVLAERERAAEQRQQKQRQEQQQDAFLEQARQWQRDEELTVPVANYTPDWNRSLDEVLAKQSRDDENKRIG